MIVINNKLAKEAWANVLNSKRVTLNSSLHAWMLQALIQYNFCFDVKRDPFAFIPKDFSLDAWTTLEIAIAEALLWLLALLRKLECKDIEKLLNDVSAYRSRHPDLPKGAWPHVKGPR